MGTATRALAVIPARGGSKRIPRKNIKLFRGKPMIGWSIEAARASALFDHILVSTDDPEIAMEACKWGAEAPFLRPAELANDHAGVTGVIAHAIDWARAQGWPAEPVCCIYATAPFLRPEDLRRGLDALQSGPWAYALSATTFAAPVARAFHCHPAGGLQMFFPDHYQTRSQDLPQGLHDAAQFCWGRADAWLGGRRVFDRDTVPVILPRWRVQDIDTPEDWQRAELVAPLVENDKA